ncbi:hypothetical protein [Haloarchaeobius salinus]|uniref:hypothetical protein n=1 Tax=Haloarchaeobius salinus TaxID=1198298 RepID=UPI00210C29D1|nr:hypothetical protein [Haloarchaeobius salinus]
MTTVTTDGARTGVEHSDHDWCSFPFFVVTATAVLPHPDSGTGSTSGDDDVATAAATPDTETPPTTRVAAE